MGRWVEPIYCLIMLIIGFLKSMSFFPYVYICIYANYVAQNIDSRKEKFLMTFLNGTTALGDILGLLLGDLIINWVNWGWHAFIIFFSSILFLSGLAFYLFLAEIPLERPQQNNCCTELKEQFHQLKIIFRQPNISLLVFEYSMHSCLFYNQLTWYPYFFTVTGLSQWAQLLAIIPSLCCFTTPLYLEPALGYFSKVNQIIITMLSVNVASFILLIALGHQIEQVSNLPFLALILFVGASSFCGPFARAALLEMTIEGRRDPVTIFHMYNFFSFLQCASNALTYFLIGYFMERGKYRCMQISNRSFRFCWWSQ